MSTAKAQSLRMWTREFEDLIRGASGGFLFGIPLLYTMEVWWIGSFTVPFYMLTALVTTFVVVLLLSRMAGFRRAHHVSWIDAAMDSIEALALGLVCSALVLFLLREISVETPLDETLGKVIFEGVPFTIGVALANQFLSRSVSDDQEAQHDSWQDTQSTEQHTLYGTITDIGATLIGALIIAFNIAPTDEIPMLAAAISPPWLLLMMGASLLISYGIVFEANFADQQRRRQQQGIFQQPISETVASYLVSLIAAGFMLWFFQQLSFADPWPMWLSHTLILGLPATVGGAAGRLAL